MVPPARAAAEGDGAGLGCAVAVAGGVAVGEGVGPGVQAETAVPSATAAARIRRVLVWMAAIGGLRAGTTGSYEAAPRTRAARRQPGLGPASAGQVVPGDLGVTP